MEINSKSYYRYQQFLPNCVSTFPYSQLCRLGILDHEGIRKALTSLKSLVTVHEFYANKYNCLDYTLDFILTYSTLLIKNNESGYVLLSFLDLLRDIMIRTNSLKVSISHNAESRILSLLKELMNSTQQNYVKLEGGKVIIEMLHKHYEDISLVCFLSSQAANIFSAENSIAELSRLLRILFEWQHEIDMSPVIAWMSNDCMQYLLQKKSPEVQLEILSLYWTYFNQYKNDNVLIESIKTYLYWLCMLMDNSTLRKVAQQLLAFVLEKLYCTDIVIWPGGRDAILNEISNLPDNYEKWTNVKLKIFYVIAYELGLHSRILWNYSQIKTSIDNCCSDLTSQSVYLKAVIYLYPTVKRDIDTIDRCNTSRILVDTLVQHKYFTHLLTYHPTQIVWFFKNVKDSYRCMALKHWFTIQNEDYEIIEILNEHDLGFILIKFLVILADNDDIPRVIRLINKLSSTPHLSKTVLLGLLTSCNNPITFTRLFQLDIPPSENLRHSYLQLDILAMLAGGLFILQTDKAMQTACYYGCRLLRAYKLPYAASTFAVYPASVICLVRKSGDREDDTAIAALSLLKELIMCQVQSEERVQNNIPMLFNQTIIGSTERILLGLNLLWLILEYNEQNLLISLSENGVLELYYSIHNLTRVSDTVSKAFKVLRLLIRKSNNLAFSLVTPNSLPFILRNNIVKEAVEPLLNFLLEWLTQIVPYEEFIQIPRDYIELILKRISYTEESCKYVKKIFELLGYLKDE